MILLPLLWTFSIVHSSGHHALGELVGCYIISLFQPSLNVLAFHLPHMLYTRWSVAPHRKSSREDRTITALLFALRSPRPVKWTTSCFPTKLTPIIYMYNYVYPIRHDVGKDRAFCRHRYDLLVLVYLSRFYKLNQLFSWIVRLTREYIK